MLAKKRSWSVLRSFSSLLLGISLTLLPASGLAGSAPEQRPALAPAPSWELKDLAGEAHRLEDWRGKWVLMKLGITVCPACGRQLEELSKVQDQIAQLGVDIIAIYLRQDRYTVKTYWKKQQAGFRPTILYDWRGRLVLDYGVSETPKLVLVDPRGRIVWDATYTPGPDLVQILGSYVGTATMSRR